MSERDFDERELSRAEVLSLPWPSPEQHAAFAAHVCWAHSWYKHLPLLTGGEIVVFLAADAGEGYPDTAPRLHHGWKTTAEYRTRFGHLDYMWRLTPAARFRRDAGPAIRLPPDLLAAARVTLFPFASSDFNAPEACRWGIHDAAFKQLRAGTPHPAGDLLMAWWDSQTAVEELWSSLDSDEQDLAVQSRQSESAADLVPLPQTVAAYLRSAGLADAVYAGLQHAEEAKVLGAIGGLAAILLRWGAEAPSRSPDE